MKKHIHTLINKHTNKTVWGLSFVAVVAFWLMALSLTSCNKEPQPDQRKPITVQVKTEGLLIKEMTKSFDPSQWTYNYNPNSYDLTFTGSQGTNYTFTKSVYELQQGFAVSILPDTYTITYATVHPIAGNLDDKLDISINETKSITNAGELVLNSLNEDALIVLDCNFVDAYINNSLTSNESHFFTVNGETYRYAYYSVYGDLQVNYTTQAWYMSSVIIPNVQKNNIYHLVNSVNGGTSLNVQPFNYNIIGF